MSGLSMRQQKDNRTKDKVAPRHLADPRQAAILLLRDIELRDQDRKHTMTRVQLTAPMLRRLWNRPRLSPEFLEQVSAWLAVAGWCFFNAGVTYAAIRMSAVKNWPRLGTKRIADTLNGVAIGEFPFEEHEHLLIKGEERERKQGEPSDREDSEDKESNDNE
jgi:hypothetical protein